MELNQMCSVLQAATSSDQTQRKNAENTLKQYQHQPGHLTGLLRVAVEPSLEPGIRQVAAISFKNLVKADWEPAEGPSLLSDQDRAQVKENLLESIVRCPPLIRSQLGECAKYITYSDFPEQWPGLLPSVLASLGSGEQPRVWGALYVLRVLTRKYEFKDEEDRAPLAPVVNAAFPPLLAMLQNLVATNSAALDVADLTKLCLKTFWSATWMEAPPILLQPDQFTGWMTVLHTLLVRPVPEEDQPTDPDDRKLWPWWKVKKWVLHIFGRLCSRYGETKHCRDGSDRVFSKLWVKNCAERVLDAHLALVGQIAEGKYVSPRVTNLALQYLGHAIKTAATWKLLKPHTPDLVATVLLPLMCYDDEDAELWRDDPHEYIRKQTDIVEEMYSPKSAAASFVHTLCTTRQKGNLEALMQQIVTVFGEYQAAQQAAQGPAGGHLQPVSEVVARRLDGALLAIGTLSDMLKKTEPYKAQLEPMLAQYVQPLFASPYGYLRAKAAWTAGLFADIRFAEGKGTGAVFNALFQACVNALRDVDLPVRVDAVVALRCFVDAFSEAEAAALKPLIPALLDEFFKLMNEVDNDDMVATLESIVEKFGEEMAPYAVGLMQHLAIAFWRIVDADDKENAEDGEECGPLAAFGCLRALSTVLDTVSSLPHLMPQLEPIVFPIMKRMISTEGADVMEEVLELVAYFSYYSPSVSPALWSLWPQIMEMVKEYGIDYFDSALLPLDNYISRGTDHFLADPGYLTSLNAMIEHVLADDDLDESDVQPAPKLMEIVLQNCRGRVDACVPPYLSLALRRLHASRSPYMQDLCMNVVASAFFYNPGLALATLAAQGASPAIFSTWCVMIAASRRSGGRKHFRREYDKKVQVLGLLTVLALPDAALPPELVAGLDRLLGGTTALLAALKDQQEEEKEEGEDTDDDDDDDEVGTSGAEESPAPSPGGLGDDEDDTDEEVDEQYLERMARATRRLNRHHEESEDDEDDWTEDEDVSTPLDPIDPFVAFADTLASLQQHMPGRFEVLTARQDAEMRAVWQDLMQHAAAQRAAKAAQTPS